MDVAMHRACMDLSALLLSSKGAGSRLWLVFARKRC